VTALFTALLAPIADWPWFDCITCGAHADCGDGDAPAHLDFNLLTNYVHQRQRSDPQSLPSHALKD
jgi:hypothetical protein